MTFRSRLYTTGALRAVVSGSLRVLRAPRLLLGIYLLTIIAVAPFAVVLGARLQAALASQQITHDPAHAIDADIDAEWWFEFIRHARGLEATFTPAIVGAAAPLSSLSAVLDGDLPHVALIGPIALYAALWAFLWGGVLTRFQIGGLGMRAFLSAGRRTFVRFLCLGLASALVYLLLYATVHTLLFGPMFGVVREHSSTEMTAFAWRVAFYVLFGICLLAVNIIVDYTRVFTVITNGSIASALRHAVTFVRARLGSVLCAYLLISFVFVLVLAGYAIVDVNGGARVGGWRAVILGQAFVVARLALRLMFAATALELADGTGKVYRSVVEDKPGPPAPT